MATEPTEPRVMFLEDILKANRLAVRLTGGRDDTDRFLVLISDCHGRMQASVEEVDLSEGYEVVAVDVLGILAPNTVPLVGMWVTHQAATHDYDPIALGC